MWRNCDDTLSRFDTISERDGQTNGQTDKQTEMLYQYRASAHWRAIKKQVIKHEPDCQQSDLGFQRGWQRSDARCSPGLEGNATRQLDHQQHRSPGTCSYDKAIECSSDDTARRPKSNPTPDKHPQVVIPLFCGCRTEPSSYFLKLALTRTPDHIQPTRWGLTLV